MRLLAAIVVWFAMLVLTEELIEQLAGQAVGGLAAAAGSIPLIIFFRKKLDHRPMAGMGLARTSAIRLLVAGFGLGTLAMGVVLTVSVATHAIHLGRWNPEGLSAAHAAGLLGSQLVFFLGVGFTEELLFRGHILQNLGERRHGGTGAGRRLGGLGERVGETQETPDPG
ncbi:MAG TPA: hypothetical protein VN840_19800 [Streptosporangiaceae bacterium]|nr:hypothetical protein [Streptosporangiaceae bacterium]